ncbi:MAG: DUF5989 family protein, partial [Myxococcota bacterium]
MRRLLALALSLREVAAWLRERRLGWLSPLVFLLVGVGGLLALAGTTPAIRPLFSLLFLCFRAPLVA